MNALPIRVGDVSGIVNVVSLAVELGPLNVVVGSGPEGEVTTGSPVELQFSPKVVDDTLVGLSVIKVVPILVEDISV